MNEPIFKKEFLKTYLVVEEPGTYIVKSANSYLLEDGDKTRYLLNLRAATIEGLEKCLSILGNRLSCPYSELNECFITGTLWENSVSDKSLVPAKGENVIATYDYNSEGVLWCVSITLIPRKTLEKFNPDSFNRAKQLFSKIMTDDKRGN